VRVLNRAIMALAATGMASALSVAAASGASAQTATSASGTPFIGNFSNVSTVGSTVPANGDVNPYGTVVVQHSQGLLHRGDVLVSNFNNSANQQGTGSTIVEVSPSGSVTQFAQINAASLPGACPGGVGLTTALTVLSSGWVIVGSLPTVAGNSATAQAGCLIVLNSSGQVRETFSGHGINGPWDLTALDAGSVAELFVTNVLNGTVAGGGNIVNGGTVERLLLVIPNGGLPRLVAATTIGSGFAEETNPSALVVGPTGVGLGANGTLYVADTLNSRIAAIGDAVFRLNSAGTGTTVSEGGALNNELGLTIAPNGDILTVNGGNGNLVEVTPGGAQVAVQALDTTPTPPGEPGNGALFGLAVAPGGAGVYFVDDDTNTLNLLN
jgi:hypothetical protein